MFLKDEKSHYKSGIWFGILVIVALLLPFMTNGWQSFSCYWLFLMLVNEPERLWVLYGCIFLSLIVLSGIMITVLSIRGLKVCKANQNISRIAYNFMLFVPIASLSIAFLVLCMNHYGSVLNILFFLPCVIFTVFPVFAYLPKTHMRMASLVLASGSPRRAELIEQVKKQVGGLRVVIDPSDIPEIVLPGELPEVYAMRVAKEKAEAVAARTESDSIVLGCDTVVALAGNIFGKPANQAAAIEMFRSLCGKTHEVITGIYLMRVRKDPKFIGTFEKTYVTFGAFDEKIVYNYVESGLNLDKAGGYGLQDEAIRPLITRLEGNRDNVIGLPVKLVARILVENF